MSESQITMLVGVLVGGGFIVGGVVEWLLALRWKGQAKASQRWPSVMGRVVHTGVRQETDSESSALHYFPEVHYEYAVGGRAYRSTRIAHTGAVSYGEHNLHKLEADMIAYAVGEPVQVFFNPDDPSQAVLEHRAPQARIMLILSAVFIPVGIGVVAVVLILNTFVLN